VESKMGPVVAAIAFIRFASELEDAEASALFDELSGLLAREHGPVEISAAIAKGFVQIDLDEVDRAVCIVWHALCVEAFRVGALLPAE